MFRSCEFRISGGLLSEKINAKHFLIISKIPRCKLCSTLTPNLKVRYTSSLPFPYMNPLIYRTDSHDYGDTEAIVQMLHSKIRFVSDDLLSFVGLNVVSQEFKKISQLYHMLEFSAFYSILIAGVTDCSYASNASLWHCPSVHVFHLYFHYGMSLRHNNILRSTCFFTPHQPKIQTEHIVMNVMSQTCLSSLQVKNTLFSHKTGWSSHSLSQDYLICLCEQPYGWLACMFKKTFTGLIYFVLTGEHTAGVTLLFGP